MLSRLISAIIHLLATHTKTHAAQFVKIINGTCPTEKTHAERQRKGEMDDLNKERREEEPEMQLNSAVSLCVFAEEQNE